MRSATMDGKGINASSAHHRIGGRTKKSQCKPIRHSAGRKNGYCSDENVTECWGGDTRLASLSTASEIRPTIETRGDLLPRLMPIRTPDGNGDQSYWLDA
jgi:hypothetical protein